MKTRSATTRSAKAPNKKVPRISVFLVILLFLPLVNHAQESSELFTLYLVRHAEKELNAEDPKNPPLTPCGQERAASLEVLLAEVDLEAVYSTDYLRTRGTAEPVARNKGLEIRLYDSKKLEDFARMLLERKEDALIVGHSNSTPALAGLLTGQQLEAMDESIYNRVYQVVIHKESGRLHLLHTSFRCEE